MVFASTCEHASSTFIFASMSTDEISLRAASILKNTDGEQRALRKFSRRNLDLSLLKRNVLHQVIWLTPLNQVYNQLCLVGDDVKLRQVASSAVHQVDAQEDPKLSNLTLGTHHRKKLKVTILSSVVT